MNMILKTMTVAALAVGASSAQAANLLAFAQLGQPDTISYTDNGAAGFTIGTTGPNQFLVTINDPSTGSSGFVLSSLTLSATGDAFAVNTGGITWSQALTGGSLSFTTLAAFELDGTVYAMGSNLLSLSFLGGAIEANVPGTAGSARVTLPGSSFTSATSDVLGPPLGISDLSIALSGANPCFTLSGLTCPEVLGGVDGQNVDVRFSNFTADSAGTLSGAVPEPASWAMMIAGFGLVGLSRRRQRNTTVAA